MHSREFVGCVSDVLKANNIKKPISIPKKIFHISDDEGTKQDFSVKQTDKAAFFTKQDIQNILEACLYVIKESLKEGNTVTLTNFGKFYPKYSRQRNCYIPRFQASPELKSYVKVYNAMAMAAMQDSGDSDDEDDGE